LLGLKYKFKFKKHYHCEYAHKTPGRVVRNYKNKKKDLTREVERGYYSKAPCESRASDLEN
jgi:hypothetical protein